MTNNSAKGHLAVQGLIYDKIIIPTKDFGIVHSLLNWLGYDRFYEAIISQSIGFIHLPSMLGYVGNGVGISGFSIGPSKERKFEWWQDALFNDMHKAIELQVQHSKILLTASQQRNLSKDILASSLCFEYQDNEFHDHITDETYRDIMGSRELSALVSILSGTPNRIDLERLPGIGPNQIQASRPGPIKESVDVVLRVAEFNLTLLLASRFDNADLLAPSGADLVIQSKLSRSGANPEAIKALISLFELTNVPDPGIAVSTGQVELAKVWDLRKRRISQKFRRWMRDASAEHARDLEKAYVESLGKESWVESLPARALRFLTTTAAGAASPIAGIALSVSDSFFIERLLGGYSPKIFIDQMRSITRREQQ